MCDMPTFREIGRNQAWNVCDCAQEVVPDKRLFPMSLNKEIKQNRQVTHVSLLGGFRIRISFYIMPQMRLTQPAAPDSL